MEMMNSCSVGIPFKYLIFNLEFSWALDKIVLIGIYSKLETCG
jgi:hypothetical protein